MFRNETQEIVDSALLTDTPPLSAPLQLLLRPLRRRFVFHFCRPDKETSRPDKPEWCFSQVCSRKSITVQITSIISMLKIIFPP